MENKPQQQHQKQIRLESQEWYMGMLTRHDVEPYLKKEGDFVVRASENNGPLELVLSVRNSFRVCHFTLWWNSDRKQWSLACDKSKQFDSVAEMVEHYHKNSIPNGDYQYRMVKEKKELVKEKACLADKKNKLRSKH
uniref:SH2 domain-containing protein n=1 Tax=Steinernema glaseri TaxID=37863 RepID=A0A1I7ZCE9_9BILA